MMAKTANAAKKMTKNDPRLYMVRLEADAEELTTHDLFIDAEQNEQTRRAAFVVQMKGRVQAGAYHPNLYLIAERMLADVMR